ncbi:Vacuolar protein sorting-associated protein 68 [Vanrija albida]|uniref:Vacuolar protein sorting-associated protein 68 n=1 Tax=Vanrija albida TaxID=181172 RepID=A0ABR3PY97_9TREE
MSIPRAQYDPRNVFRFSLPRIEVGPKAREVGTYISGALFTFAYFLMIDAATVSKHAKPPPDAPYDTVPVHVQFVDWVPAILSTLGFLVISLLDKTHLHSAFSGDSWGSDGPAAWRARVVLFLGVALMAGGLAGSLTVLILKYIVPNYTDYIYYGIANVGMNAGIMLSAMVLWISQSGSDEYEYQLTV